MKQQVFNPFLPLTEYVPDGEPHVFGDRVYLYGSHDEAHGSRFCVRDYTVWSAPADDLSNWKCHGVTYRKDQDPRSKPGKLVDYYAPDCVRGNDGRYYLYYVAMGPNTRNFGPMSVAVSDNPAGPFAYLGDIRCPDGTPVLKFLNNDPAVLNDNGRIWLYYGWGLGRDFRSKLLKPVYDRVLSSIAKRSLQEIRDTKPSILSCAVVELENDMLTVKGEPRAVLDSKTTAPKGSPLYGHPFYEAPSIRKFGELYYLVYSAGADNSLAYATSRYPDQDFRYRGVIISNAELCLNGNRQPKAPAGTIHGGIERIGGQYYVFYHRCTHNTDFSRQACAEPIEISPDGTIRQVELTSCGLNGGALLPEGIFPAGICCNLYNERATLRIGQKKGCVIFGENGAQYIRDFDRDTTAVYKYFDLTGVTGIVLTARGSGRIDVHGNELTVSSAAWQEYRCPLQGGAKNALRFICTEGVVDLLNFRFTKEAKT